MEVILLENISKLGKLGETVRVKAGFGRNFLIPQGKAVRATESNTAAFEARRADLEAAAAVPAEGHFFFAAVAPEFFFSPSTASRFVCCKCTGCSGFR